MSSEYATQLDSFILKSQELQDFSNSELAQRLLVAFNRIIIWLRTLHDLRGDEKPSVLLASAHSKLIEIWVLVPFGLLHSAFTSLRTVMDICTSYTFYCSHPIEWEAICDGIAPWEGRAVIVDWHVHYTPCFREINTKFGLSDILNREYKVLSSYVHCIPLTGLPTMTSLKRTPASDKLLENFITIAETVDYDLNLLMLSVFHQIVPQLSTTDFKTIIKGISRKKLAAAGIILPRV